MLLSVRLSLAPLSRWADSYRCGRGWCDEFPSPISSPWSHDIKYIVTSPFFSYLLTLFSPLLQGQVPPYAQPQMTGFAVQEAIIKTCELLLLLCSPERTPPTAVHHAVQFGRRRGYHLFFLTPLSFFRSTNFPMPIIMPPHLVCT